MRVVATHGVAGVSHRTVSKEAGQPATAAAYYFRSIDDLLTAALSSVMDADSTRLRQVVTHGRDGVTGLRAVAELMAWAVGDRAHLLAEYELFLLAARDSALRPPTHRWLEAVAELGRRHTDDPVRVAGLVAAFDGLLLHALLYDEPPSAEEFEAILRMLLSG
ncbi:transcriptional regulator, TetR family [Actinoalloteichus hymeniacidonis]|uniref:Transcriptional regulator, TetR family n=1 Tax=Actinoalloteichus hymeniacidonis TaxID=340345 RepID=A0AAC9HP01_9PSEU|nr:transcriptional regulator, TetR family [Actinoalloteichus hymeniacidonis]